MQREAAVKAGVHPSKLSRVDALLVDDDSISTRRTEWNEEFRAGVVAIDVELRRIAKEREDMAPVVIQYLRERSRHMKAILNGWDRNMIAPLASYLFDYVIGIPDEVVGSLFDGVPRWQNVAPLDKLMIIRDSTSVEARTRASAAVIHDVAEHGYKPLICNLTRLVRAKKGLDPLPQKFRTLGAMKTELVKALGGHPLPPPLYLCVDDEAVFIRNGVGHGGGLLPFDTRTGQLTIEDDNRTEQYNLERLFGIQMDLFRRARTMWQVFYKCSGQMLRDSESAGPHLLLDFASSSP